MGNIIDIIYLSNGRLNWHAIEGIIAAIVAIIVIIELLPKLKGLFDSKKKDERKFVLDRIQIFLTPCLKYMEYEINLIEDKEIKYYQRDGQSEIAWNQKILDREFGKGFAKIDVFRKHSSLKNLIYKHDEIYDNLIEICEEIKKVLEKNIDIECLSELMEEFNRNHINGVRPFNEKLINNPIKYCIYYFINCKYYTRHGSVDSDWVKFLKEFKTQIVGCIESDELQLLRKNEKKALDELKGLDKKIVVEIGEIISNYYNKHNLVENEIDPPKNSPNPYQ